MFARFTLRKISSAASRLSSWVSNSSTTRWLSKSAIPKLRGSKRALLVIVLLASSATALTSIGIRRAMQSGNNAAFVSQSVPATMTAGESYAVTVSMLNQGTTTWTPGQAYRLGSQNPQDNTIWMTTTNRVNLLPGDSVSPGATTTFSFVVKAPGSPGSYNFQWRMVRDGVEWFGATTPNIAVQVLPRPVSTKLKEYVYAGGRLISSEEKACVPAFSPAPSASLPQGGETRFFNVSLPPGCDWTATPSAVWITINSGSSGAGNGTVNYTVAANSGPQRVGTITVNGQSFTITQAPNLSTCGFSLNKSSDTFPQEAGSRPLNLTAGAGCAWNAVSSDPSWLTASPTDGVGDATINYSVTANGGQQRVGSISIKMGGQTFATLTVTQLPNQASCTFALSPSSWQYPVEGGNGSFSVMTGAGCFWDANTTYGWIPITGGATNPPGGGGGPVSFTVHANNGGSRIGTINVKGQDFTVTQCGYVVSPTFASFNGGGGTRSITVSAAAGCTWSATSNVEWIHITSGANGAGNGSVNYSVDGISDACSFGRSGDITVAGRTVSIVQSNIVQPCEINPACCEQSAMGADSRGLTARYFSNTRLSGQPTLQRIDPVVNFDWVGASPDKLLPANDFSARWNAQLAAPSSETYTFFLYSDGGARLWMNNRLVIDRWQPPFEPLTQSAPVDLKAGAKADVRVEYYNAGRGGVVYLLWSSASTPRQIIPRRYLYPEAATNGSTLADTDKQTGMLLPPGSDACPKAARPQPSAPSGLLAIPHSRAGLVLLIACGVSAILLGTRWRQARSLFTAATGVVSRLQDQIALRLGEIFRIAAAASDKLKFVVAYGKKIFTGIWDKLNVVGFGKRLLAGAFDKLRFVGHFLAALLPTFQVLSHVGAVIRLGKRKLAELLPERVRNIAWQALALWRSSGLARLKPILRRALAIAMIVILATPLSPTQADGLARAAGATWRTMSAAAKGYVASSGGGALDRLIKALGARPGMAASAAAQAEQVDELQVCPRQLVMFVGERYTLTPVALDINPGDGSKKVVHGVGMSWSSQGISVARVSSFGQVEAMGVGNTTVVVQCGGVSKHIPVEVRIGSRPTGSNQQADIDPTNDCAAEQSSAFAPQSAASAQQIMIDDNFVLLDGDPDPLANSRATHFRNSVGNPRFSTNLGSSNYQFDVPVVSVGGRGAGAGIGMTLNSRVWNVDDGRLTFNYVGAYPAPGWSMGYGKIIRNYNATATGVRRGVGSGNSPGDYLLVAGDGTRIRLAAKYDATIGRWLHESDDGSFLQFDPRTGEMRRPDGSQTIYSSVNGCLLPTAMIGANGGAITMTYRDYCEGAGCVRVFRHRTALSAVRDTRGGYVTFHYYGDGDYQSGAGRPAGELAAIKAPDRDGVQQEVIQVQYQLITLKYDFGGLAVDAPANNSQIQVVRRVYYPQTGRGFLFLDYSTYGMPRKISSRMGMRGAGGAVTDGTEIAYTTYDYWTKDTEDPYDRNQEGSLNDFPQFRFRKEWWLGKTDSTGAPTTAPTVYEYSRTTNASTEEATMIYHDKNCKEVTTTGTDSSQLSFGKVISVERKKSEPVEVLSKQVFTYTTGPDGEPEIEKIESFDEAGQGTLVSFGYGPYGRVNDKYEYGYKQAGAYQVRRSAHYDYVDAPSYLAARFLRLVSRVTFYDAAGAPKAKTETFYDDYAAMGGMQSYGLNPSLYPPNHDATYDQTKVMRGNATAVKTFSNIASGEATTRRVRYDIFGNVVEAEMSCCVKKYFGFSVQTYYSQPEWVRSGPDSETELNLKTDYRYNNFTGRVEEETNPDGWPTTYEYDEALRLKRVTNEATGAVAETKFQDDNGNDLLTHVSKAIYDDQGTQRIITGKQWFDGSGRVVRAGTGTGDSPDSYDMTATVYDRWGRVVKQSNPYLGDADGNPQAGVTQYWTVNTYDELSRVRKVTLPDTQFPDTQFVQTDYSGATATSGATVIATDTVGRSLKSEVDGMGRLVKVTEQNPANGNLEWETIYSYDVLDNLTQTNQGGQTRTFTYDDKGRLKSETTPEAGMTRYEYTDFDAVSKRTDARGVVTTYTYGPLNLLTGVSYNNVTGVAPTAPVSIFYKNASPGKGQIERVTDGTGDDGESYTYDSFGLLQSCTRKIDGISYEKQYEYNKANQMTLMIYPSGKRVKVAHDARGRLSALQRVDLSGTPQESYLSGINYRADGLVSSQTLGDGAIENFGYSDDRLQLTSQKVMKGGATLLSLNYGYGASAGKMGNGSTPGNSGQLVSVTGTINSQNRNQAFTYDNVGRLATATGFSTQGAWARRHEYDRYGNRTAVFDAVSGGNPLQNTMIAQANGMTTNRIASVNGTAFEYDVSGNVTREGARTYTYDAEKRLVSVGEPGGESYGHDAGNHRVKKVVGGVVTHYVWEGDQVIAEYERGGGSTSATGTRYYHRDRLSTRVITDGAGNVKGTTDHLPFGEEIGFTGESEKHKFTTYERDGTGLNYAVNRHYASHLGRFNQVDPLGVGASSLTDPQSLNLYAYSANDPVNYTDPNGMNFTPILVDADHPYFGYDGHAGGGGGGGGIRNCSAQYGFAECGGWGGILGGNFGDGVAEYSREYGGLSETVVESLRTHEERVANSRGGNGFRTIEEITGFNIYYWIYSDGSYATYFNISVNDAETHRRYQYSHRSARDPWRMTGDPIPIPGGQPEMNPIIRNYRNFADSGFGSALMAITPLPIKGGIIATYSKSLLGHIFRNAFGHVNPATVASQARYMKLFESVAANLANLRTNFPLPTAAANAGVQAFTQTFKNGKQAWVYVRGGKIIDAGINLPGAHR